MYTHKLLVATKAITDPVFSGSVVFIFKHSEEKGAEGVIINSREIGKIGFSMMQDLFNAPPGDFKEAKEMMLDGRLQSVPLFLGGPCQTPGIYFMHGYQEYLHFLEEHDAPEFDLGIPSSFDTGDDYEEKPENKLVVMDGVYFGSPYTFGHIIEAGKIDENKFKFFTGQAKWRPGQLENEIDQGAWNVVDAQGEVFFDNDALFNLIESVGDDAPKKWFPLNIPGFDPSRN